MRTVNTANVAPRDLLQLGEYAELDGHQVTWINGAHILCLGGAHFEFAAGDFDAGSRMQDERSRTA